VYCFLNKCFCSEWLPIIIDLSLRMSTIKTMLKDQLHHLLYLTQYCIEHHCAAALDPVK
jgi:hypothetical protein